MDISQSLADQVQVAQSALAMVGEQSTPGHKARAATARALLLLLICLIGGGCGWQRRSTAGPTLRGHAMAYDAVHKQIMFYGGELLSPTSGLNGTWEWNGLAWIEQFPATNPGPLYKPALACDLSRQRVVLFGGVNGASQSSDTWEWDGATWTRMNPAHVPQSRHHHAMAYDSKRKVVILFGGYTALDSTTGQRNDLADTWQWDGADWTQLHPPHSPPLRDGHAMAYDPGRDRIVLFGGAQDVGSFAYLNDTWEWNGADWQQMSAVSPPPASGVAMAYDERHHNVTIFGGLTSEPKLYVTATWSWNGYVWRKQCQLLGPLPSGRSDHAMAYDANRHRMVMSAGFTGNPGVLLGDTWER